LADLSKPPLLVREKDKRNRSILRMAAVPGSRQVVTAMADGRILLWTIGHLPEPTLIGAARGAALAVSPDGRWAVTAGDEMAVMRWDLRDAADGTWLGNTAGAQIRALAVGGSPPRVFGGDDRGRIFSWDSSGADNWGRVIGRHGHDTDERPKRTRVRSIVIAEDNSWLASVADDGLIECWDTNSGALTSLQPVTLPNNITSAGGCLLASDKRGGLTLFDVVLGPAPSARPNRPVDLVLIVDQWWCNEIRGDHRLDLAALKADLCGDRIARAVIPCPHLPALHGFRKYLEGTGWTVPSAPPGRAAIEEIVSLAAEAAAHSEVLLVSGNSDFSARLSEVPHRDRITIIDDVARWSR
jgi:WD40 repeat protein